MEDPSLEHGSVKKLAIRSGSDGEASVRVRLAGPALALPLLPLDTTAPVRIQLLNLASGACWEGIHTVATTNNASKFESVSN